MLKLIQKITVCLLAVLLIAGLVFSARPAAAIWSNVPIDISRDAIQVFVHQEIHDILPDMLKQLAMQRWQKAVMKLVAKKGGYIWNYGEYLYGSGNSAASQYWRAFLQNCANIDPTISLKIKATAVDQTTQYDWCPVRINVRGVNIQENIDLSDNFGWSDFKDAIDNNGYKQYLQLASNVQEARDAAEETAFMKAVSSGVKPAEEELAQECYNKEQQTGKIMSPEEMEECKRVKIPVQSFLDMLNAATGGVATATANTKSQVASAITYMLLNQVTDWALDKFGGKYGDYFQ